MLGHEDVADDDEFVLLPDLLEVREETVAGSGRGEARLATITTECDQVEMSVSVVTLEVDAHVSMVESCREGSL